ncbi:hypothetical protein RUR49_19685 [Pseudoxanthobacter sp. M-2]|uniref:hypothetical protein n=1 Tax=Pseudoxanthobacter sp. M-2 TaxID=3078754 RepID=UPI0038FC7DE7
MTLTLENDEAVRGRIAALLAGGLATEVEPRCDTHEDVQAVIARLRALAPDDLVGRLVVAGFTDHVVVHADFEQPCESCMYYLVHRRFCELPELAVPVEPDWSCRLWRI